jgi:predicted RNA binding protein YcfA (HicA-like mRNA interferase family)
MGKYYSQRELINMAIKRGWAANPGRGKGSHVMMSKAGKQSFPIPKIIKKGLLENIKKRLEITD